MKPIPSMKNKMRRTGSQGGVSVRAGVQEIASEVMRNSHLPQKDRPTRPSVGAMKSALHTHRALGCSEGGHGCAEAIRTS